MQKTKRKLFTMYLDLKNSPQFDGGCERGLVEEGGQAKYVICCKLGEFLLLLQ
jgi:hypothetical protein